jgi:pimeloyl-ACP methyl ester carboxylesterase
VPVTIVTGADDKIVSPETQSKRLHQALKNSRYVSLQGVGHMVNYTALEKVLSVINEAGSGSRKLESI